MANLQHRRTKEKLPSPRQVHGIKHFCAYRFIVLHPTASVPLIWSSVQQTTCELKEICAFPAISNVEEVVRLPNNSAGYSNLLQKTKLLNH